MVVINTSLLAAAANNNDAIVIRSPAGSGSGFGEAVNVSLSPAARAIVNGIVANATTATFSGSGSYAGGSASSVTPAGGGSPVANSS